MNQVFDPPALEPGTLRVVPLGGLGEIGRNMTVYELDGFSVLKPQIAGLATQLKEVASPEFKAYAKQVKANAAALCAFLVEKGYKLATNGTENHLMLWDLRPLGLTGSKVEKVY